MEQQNEFLRKIGTNYSEKAKDLFRRILTEPIKVANELDKMADELKNVAKRLRESVEKRKKNPYIANSGLSDKVQIKVVKQENN